MPVLATCTDCDSGVLLGERPAQRGTTACPDCGSTRYDSELIESEDRDRIVEIAAGTPGIGQGTAENIADRMPTIERLRRARPDELRAIPGVGQQNGAALLERIEREGL